VEREQERLQHMTDVGFHKRDLEWRRQRVVEREAEKARLQARRATAATAEELRECEERIAASQEMYYHARRMLNWLLRNPEHYASNVTPDVQLRIAELQYGVSYIEARLEEKEQQRMQEELEKLRQPKQRAIPGH
jgi:hypothetical protein